MCASWGRCSASCYARRMSPCGRWTRSRFAGYVKPLVWAEWLAIPSRLIVRHLLTALAAPLVLIAVVQALMQAQIPKGNGVKLIGLLLLNTTVAILIGLAVANRLAAGQADVASRRRKADGSDGAKDRSDSAVSGQRAQELAGAVHRQRQDHLGDYDRGGAGHRDAALAGRAVSNGSESRRKWRSTCCSSCCTGSSS